VDDLQAVIGIVHATGALDVARAAAAAEAQRAIDAAKTLPDNAYTQALIALGTQLLDRQA
jgi:octaprenyl-diphosphate synthase